MAINGYRTIPTDGSGELYSWPGCVVLVSAGWTDGPAFAERVAATDHSDAALAFRDLAGWLLARSGETVADFAAIMQTGSSLLCMAAGEAEVNVGDGRRVVADVSGMWAQLVLTDKPDRIELGVSAGVVPDRIDLEHGVVPATGVLLIPGGGDSPQADVDLRSTATTGTQPSGGAHPGSGDAGRAPGRESGDDRGSKAGTTPPGGLGAAAGSDSAMSAQQDEDAQRPDGEAAPPTASSSTSDPTSSPTSAGQARSMAEPSSSPAAAIGTQRRSEPGDSSKDRLAGESTPAPDVAVATRGDLAADPRGSPDASSGAAQSRHQLPFDAEFDGPPTDADGLVGIVSEEPEASGNSGSDTTTARPDGARDHDTDGPEPTGEHLSASTFVEEGEPGEPEPEPASWTSDQPPLGEATGLVPIVTTPDVPGGAGAEFATKEPATSVPAGRGRAALGSGPDGSAEAWPPPPAWTGGTASDDRGPASEFAAFEYPGSEPEDTSQADRDPAEDENLVDSVDGSDDEPSTSEASESRSGDDGWDNDWVVTSQAASDVGAADADLVTELPDDSAGGEASDEGDDSDGDDAPQDDTNERAWDSDGLDDDQSIPLLLFDDGVAVELPGDVLIGRRPDPGVRDDPSRLHTLTMTDDSQAVSRNHVELRRRNDEVSIVDCGSANGTFVEATPGELTRLDAEAPHLLRDGERVVFGKRWFEYRAPRDPESDE